MGQPTFDILWKPPPGLVTDKDDYRWFYRICELLNGGLPGATTMLSVPSAENKTGVTIRKGQLCGYAGVSNGTMDLRLFIANDTQPAYSVLGIASADIPDKQSGYLIYYGTVDGVDTSAWPVGTVLFASDTTPGALTNVPPVPPAFRVVVGSVLTQAVNGSIFVRIYPQLRPSYGSFNSLVAQDTTAGTPATIKFESTSIAKDIVKSAGNDEFTLVFGGLYNFLATIQFASTNNTTKTLAAWLQKWNGTTWVNVPGSTQEVGFSTTAIMSLCVLVYAVVANAGDRYRLQWGKTDSASSISLGTGNVAGAATDSTAVLQIVQVSV